MSTRTPTLAEVIKTALDARLADVHVSLPARVQRYDPVKQLVDAKPLIMARFVDENEQEQAVSLPVITNVPVVHPGAGGFAITFPVAVGDTVCLLFSERSLDTWLTLGGEVAEVDLRDHSINDAICFLGLRPFSAPLKDAFTDRASFGVDGGAAQIQILAGEIDIGKGADAAMMRGTDAKAAYDAHQHSFVGVPPGVTSTTLVPISPMPSSALSTISKVK